MVSSMPDADKSRHISREAASLDDTETCGREAGDKAGRELRKKFPLCCPVNPGPWFDRLVVAMEEAQTNITPQQGNAWLAGFEAGFRPHLAEWTRIWGGDADAASRRLVARWMA